MLSCYSVYAFGPSILNELHKIYLSRFLSWFILSENCNFKIDLENSKITENVFATVFESYDTAGFATTAKLCQVSLLQHLHFHIECQGMWVTRNCAGPGKLQRVTEVTHCSPKMRAPCPIQFTAELMLELTWSLSTNLFASNLFISSISPPPPPPLLVRLASLLETPLGLDPPEPSSGLRQK